jgi:ketosteroid isomerase-like protein
VLKRRTVSLLETLTLDSGASRNGRQFAVHSFNALLASEVTLENPTITEANGTFERQEIESAFSWICQQAKQTRFELEGLESVTVSGDTGEVVCVLEALVELPGVRLADGIYQARLFWRREDDNWRLERAIWTEAKR